MKLVMTLLVRNEQDILRQNLEFHFAKGVDYVIAMDNLSEDGTTDILDEYSRRGLLEWHRQEADTYDQGQWVTWMARKAASDHGADWVINNDADEFWWPLQGNLRTALLAVPPEVGVLETPRMNFAPQLSASPWYEAMTVRETAARNFVGRPLPGKACHRAAVNVEVGQGNHCVAHVPGTRCLAEATVILHFPLRSFDQLARKVSLGGAAYERNPRLQKALGLHWRILYRRWQDGTLRAWYEEQLVSEAEIEAGIAAGTHVVDRRLADWFAAHPIDGTSAASKR